MNRDHVDSVITERPDPHFLTWFAQSAIWMPGEIRKYVLCPRVKEAIVEYATKNIPRYKNP